MHIADKYGSENAEVLRTCIDVGLKCVEIDRKKRSPIDKIVATLKGLHAIQIETQGEIVTKDKEVLFSNDLIS
jgi:hypothetical protein